ncbi:hypothetical protein EV175_004976 [Coemansia sp. RSA 1933]|nr:hypothetical protein EV175_004976 [Coemansia sp. RSA 1933]
MRSRRVSESVGKQLSSVVVRDMDEGSGTYIESYREEYLNDAANSHRVLEASMGDIERATQSLERTLAWRQAFKVYPVRKRMDSSGLVVDRQGLVVVQARTQSLVHSEGMADGCQCTQGLQRQRRRMKAQSIARALGTLEDVRVTLKCIAMEHSGIDMRAAVVVPVETVALGDICVHDLLGIVDNGAAHYVGAVQHVYVTATSSVLLEHARQALRPVLARAPQECTDRIEFVMAESLRDQCTAIDQYVCNQERPTASSVCCTDDDFCSAYSHASLQKEELSGVARLAPLLPTSLVVSAGQPELIPASLADSAGPLELIPATRRQSTSSEAGATPIQLASLQRAVLGVQRMLGSLNDSIVGAESRAALAATRSKLVQQADVLMSTVAALNFGVSATDDMTGLRVPGYFERRGSSSSSSGAGSSSNDGGGPLVGRRRLSEAAHQPGTTGGLLRVLMVQLAALPMSLMVGRKSRSSVALLIMRIVRRTIHALRAMPAMRSLLLLAYKHLRIYAMVAWTAALLVWHANAAMIWSNLTTQWSRGISY